MSTREYFHEPKVSENTSEIEMSPILYNECFKLFIKYFFQNIFKLSAIIWKFFNGNYDS